VFISVRRLYFSAWLRFRIGVFVLGGLTSLQSAFGLALAALKAAGHKRGRIAPTLRALLGASRSMTYHYSILARTKARERALRFVVERAGGRPP